ncbi:GTP-binding protein [Persephonella sp.]
MQVKILVLGPFSAGKTQFIKTLTDCPISTEVGLTASEEKKKKSHTTVAMDYGKITVGNKKVHLLGTPGQERFSFMLEVLGREYDGAVLLIDSTDRENIEQTARFIDFLIKKNRPFVVGCNKQDLDGRLSPEEVAELIGIPQDRVVPLTAKDKDSCNRLINKILDMVCKEEVAA